MEFNPKKDILPPEGDKVPRPVMKALELQVMGAPINSIAKACDVSPSTVTNWLDKYKMTKLDRAQLLTSLSGAHGILSGRLMQELAKRIEEAPEKFTVMQLGVLSGINSQRAKELSTINDVEDEVKWEDVKI